MILVQRNYFILLGFVRPLNMLEWYVHLIPIKRNINNLEQVQRRATRFVLARDYFEYEHLSKLNLLLLKNCRDINE